jgi:hypothetical protein
VTTIKTNSGRASELANNIKTAATNFSNNTVVQIAGGNVNAIIDGNAAVSEMLQLLWVNM